jgi:hypothetical protein
MTNFLSLAFFRQASAKVYDTTMEDDRLERERNVAEDLTDQHQCFRYRMIRLSVSFRDLYNQSVLSLPYRSISMYQNR